MHVARPRYPHRTDHSDPPSAGPGRHL